MMRIDKLLAQMGCGSRREVKEYLKKGLVICNGDIIKKPEQHIDPNLDKIQCNGKKITFISNTYFMLYKPSGVVTATKDTREKTVLNLMQEEKNKHLFPVGRLDKDTEGLLLITDDGMLAHELLSPKKHIAKVYYAKIDGVVTNEDIKLFAAGVDIGDEKPALPAQLQIIAVNQADDECEIQITIYEGRFHQVKRMFHSIGKEVRYLKRLSMGTLTLDEQLEPGDYRPLTQQELAQLKSQTV